VAKESSQPGELPENLLSPSPQPGKISEFYILTLSIITDIVVLTAGDIVPVQAEELVKDISAKDILVEASTEKALIVGPILEVATQEAIIVPDCTLKLHFYYHFYTYILDHSPIS